MPKSSKKNTFIHTSRTMMFAELDYDKLKKRVTRILLYDVNKKRKGMFQRVVNSKTGKNRKGWYKLGKSRKVN